MKPDYKKRIERFKKAINCDSVILFSEEFNANLHYFTGFKGFGILIIHKKKRPLFITTKLDNCMLKNKEIACKYIENNFSDLIKKEIKKGAILGVDYSSITLNILNLIRKEVSPKKIKNVSEILFELRKIKDDYEINQIKKACKVCDIILEELIKKMPEMSYEKEVKTFIDVEIRKKGFKNSFETIAASEANSSNPHYSFCNKKLKKGFLVIDFGIKCNEYCSDVTRTFYLGIPSKKDEENYEKVLSVQKKCIDIIDETKDFFLANNYAKKELGIFFIHGLGHGIGLEIHEPLRKKKSKNIQILKNMAFTVEPGIYFENKFGIRIEDSVFFNKNKTIILTKFSKELICIDFKKIK
jgi:Xaa-Pro dipeptidase